MKALITGITGFVGRHLERFLKDKAEVYGTSRANRSENHIFRVDFQSETEIAELMNKLEPTHIFHLAGLSSVKDSWERKTDFIEANVMGTIHLLEAVRKTNRGIKVVTIGSSEEYGKIPPELDKVSEEMRLDPSSPYGISKSAVSMLAKLYHESYGLDITHARPFNHIGPGQRQGFVTTDFAYQIALINKGKTKTAAMRVGNLKVARDFTDVRDIAEAYYLLACSGTAGEIYNVCTGKGVYIEEILEILSNFSDKKIEYEVDPARLRVADVPRLVGNPEKLMILTGWKPKKKLEDTLRDIYHHCLKAL